MPAENVGCAGRWFFWDAHQVHVHLLHSSSTFAVITMWAGGDNVCPDVLSAKMTGHDMIHSQAAVSPAAVLAGIIVPAKDLAAGQLDVGARPMNLGLQSNDRGAWQ